jgi:hypothetical protein
MVDGDHTDLQIIKAENCPKELKKRLKMKALEREIDLQDLILEYCRRGLDQEHAEKPSKNSPKS